MRDRELLTIEVDSLLVRAAEIAGMRALLFDTGRLKASMRSLGELLNIGARS